MRLHSVDLEVLGELGLGPNEPKSSTKPLQHQPLTGIDVLQCVPANKLDRYETLLTIRVVESRLVKTRRTYSRTPTTSTPTCPDTPPRSTYRTSASSARRTTVTMILYSNARRFVRKAIDTTSSSS